MALFINGVGQDTFSMNGVAIDNLYVDGVLVWSSFVPELTIPRYELTEALVDASTVDDSANTLDTYNGLLTESDGTTPYEPTALQYPQNGLLELDNGRILDTQLTVDPETDNYGIYGIYDADGSTEYKIWAIKLFGTGLYQLYEGDQDNPIAFVNGYAFDDPIVGTWKITEGRPSFLPPLDVPDYSELIYGGDNDNGIADVSFWSDVGLVNPMETHTYSGRDGLRYLTQESGAGFYQSIETVVGATYVVSAQIGNFDGAGAYIAIDDAIPATSTSDYETTPVTGQPWIEVSLEFVATETTHYYSMKSDTPYDWIYIAALSAKRKVV